MMDNTLTFILAGGQGSRLQPLTKQRSKPSVPYGGKYRIIDFTLANCLHSGLRRLLVLTQYKSPVLEQPFPKLGGAPYLPVWIIQLKVRPLAISQEWKKLRLGGLLPPIMLFERNEFH